MTRNRNGSFKKEDDVKMASESPWHIFSLLRLIDRFG